MITNHLRTRHRQTSVLLLGISTLFLLALLDSNYNVLCGILLIFSVVLIIQARKNPYVLISSIIIAYSNYGLVIYRYWVPNLMPYNEITTSTGNIDETGLRVVIFLMYVVLSATFFYKKRYNIEIVEKKSTPVRNNKFLVGLTCVALVLIWILYYNFSLGEKSGYSPQYEYSIVFFIMGLKYAGQNKSLVFPMLLIALFYILFDFLGGQRSTGVQIAIVVLLMCFYRYLTCKNIFIFGLIGVIAVRAVAVFRTSFFFQDFTFKDIINGMFVSWLAPDTAGAAYYSSLVYIATQGFYSLAERLSQFGDFVASLIVVGTVGEGLPYIALRHHWHGFGGFLGIYMFYYLGYFGTALIGILVSYYYKLMEKVKLGLKNRDSLAYIVTIYVSATTIRWYLYTPFQLLRGVMLLSIVYFLYRMANKLTKSL